VSLAAPNAAASTPNSPSVTRVGRRTVGVLGGGQLGRMFVHTAQRMGYRVLVLDPDADAPAGGARADQLLRAAYDDPAALDRTGRPLQPR
jgi:5-(carboxyamino)imidazole ribonucleotide synthase